MKGPWYWNPIYNEIDEAETKMIGTTFLFLFYFISCRFQLKIKDNLTHKMCTRESTIPFILLYYYYYYKIRAHLPHNASSSKYLATQHVSKKKFCKHFWLWLHDLMKEWWLVKIIGKRKKWWGPETRKLGFITTVF